MIRRATIGQITEGTARVCRFGQAEAAERLAEARDSLQAVLGDPSMQPYHTDASHLLDFVMLRLDPAAQADTLTARLTASDRAQTPGVFQQALIDLRYYPYPPYGETGTASDTNTKPASPLLHWMDAIQAPARSRRQAGIPVNRPTQP